MAELGSVYRIRGKSCHEHAGRNRPASQAADFFAVLPIGISGATAGIRRLHDRDTSAWWLLAYYGIPATLTLVQILISNFSDAPGYVDGLLVLPITICLIWTIVELGCQRGTVGENPYGPNTVVGNKMKA